MKEVGLIIGLDQYSVQDERAFRKVVSDLYNPLIKILKSHKESRVSFNIPLGTLELLDMFGYESLISEIKDLYQNDRIELVCSSPYGSKLSSIPKELIESHIVLNEYGVGYYLGSKQGFEGEPSIMIRDMSGFVSSTGPVSGGLVGTLSDLGYRWVAVKPCAKSFCEFKDTGLIAIGVVNPLNEFFVSLENNEEIESPETERKHFSVIFEKIINTEYIEKTCGIEISAKDLVREGLEGEVNRKVLRFTEYFLDNLEKRSITCQTISKIVRDINKFKICAGEEINENVLREELVQEQLEMYETVTKLAINVETQLSKSSNDINKEDLSPFRVWLLQDTEEIKYNNIRSLMRIKTLLYKLLGIIDNIDIKRRNSEQDMNNIIHDISQQSLQDIISLASSIEDDKIRNLVLADIPDLSLLEK